MGPDRARWRTNIPTYAKLRFEDVYAGVDAELHGDHRQLEYDFIIAPLMSTAAPASGITDAPVGNFSLPITVGLAPMR